VVEAGVRDVSRQTKLLLGVFAICLLASIWNFLVWPIIELSGPTRVGAGPNNGGMSAGVWLVLAAIAGSVLTLGGTYLNDHLAAAREDRRAEREAREQRQRWEREDRLRGEEKEVANRQEVREARARAYKAFVAATSFPAPFAEDQQARLTQELNERYTDVLLYCSSWLEGETDALYNAALEALSDPDNDEFDPPRQQLKEARKRFWEAVRDEAQEDYSHS
jgi:hypothetical protein